MNSNYIVTKITMYKNVQDVHNMQKYIKYPETMVTVIFNVYITCF